MLMMKHLASRCSDVSLIKKIVLSHTKTVTAVAVKWE